MKDLEQFLKNIERIANALEKMTADNMSVGVDLGKGESIQVESVNTTVPQPTMPQPVVAQPSLPISNPVPSYSQDDMAKAMGRAIDMGKMADIQNIMASFGVATLMELKQEQYPELVQKLKVIGVEV